MGDWIDKIVEPQEVSLWQIARIESMLPNLPYSDYEIQKIEATMNDESFTYQAANFLIDKLKQDLISNDPRDQFNKMFKDGNI